MNVNQGIWTPVEGVQGRVSKREPFVVGDFTYFCSKSGPSGSMTIIKTSLLPDEFDAVENFRATFVRDVGRAAQIITIHKRANPLVIMNVHAPHYNSQTGRKWFQRGDSKAKSHLETMAQKFEGMTFPTFISSHTMGGQPTAFHSAGSHVIIGGDFNAQLSEGLHSMRFPASNGDWFTDVWSSKPFDSLDGRKVREYDHILTTGKFTKQVQLIIPQASDHSALATNIIFPNLGNDTHNMNIIYPNLGDDTHNIGPAFAHYHKLPPPSTNAFCYGGHPDELRPQALLSVD